MAACSYGKKMLQASLDKIKKRMQTDEDTQESAKRSENLDPDFYVDVDPDNPFDVDPDNPFDADYFPESESDSSSECENEAVVVDEIIPETDCSIESEVVYPLLIPSTSTKVNCVQKRPQTGKLDKYQFCVFCGKGVLKIARHLTFKHKSETEIAKLLVAKESKGRYKEYLLGIQRLKCRGNFIHNVEVLSSGGSDIVVAKRPSKSRPASDFLPCMYCYGFFVSDELWKHVKNCELRENGDVYECRKTLSLSRALLESATLPDGADDDWVKEVREGVLSRMNQDNICRAVKKDLLILRFGAMLLKKLGKARVWDISQRMRQLGRLVLQLQIDSPQKNLDDFITGDMFDSVIKATEQICGVVTDDGSGRRTFKKPSYAIRIGHLLVKICNVKRGCALRQQNEGGRLAAETFLSLLKSEWTDVISSSALNTLKRRKDHQVQILPLTEDLVKVRDHMLKEIENNSKAVLSTHDYSKWRKLAQMTMARLILFNKRRGGEVSRLLLQTYQNRPKWEESMNKEILSSLQGLELELIKRLDLIEVPGKKNRKVPILVTEEAKRAMDALAKTRDFVGIPEKNPFFFASRSADGYLNSWQAMKAVVDDAHVENPMSISSTRLRKYIATVCQLFDLKEGEMEWLANHMGHELNIHRDFYRLHESTVEIAKVSRVLMAIESGQAGKYAGKSLNDIGVDDIAFQSEEMGKEQVKNANGCAREECTIALEGPPPDNSDVVDPQPLAAKKKKIMSSLDSSSDEETANPLAAKKKKIMSSLDSSSDEETANPLAAKKKKIMSSFDSSSDEEIAQRKTSYVGVRRKWTNLELSALNSAFFKFLQNKVYPSGKAIAAEIAKHPCLKGRTVVQIKSKLQHLMR